MVDFKKGDIVRLKNVKDFPENDVFNKILNNRGWDIHFNMGYEVEDANHNIKLVGVKGWWMRERFEFVLPAMEPIPAPEPEIPVAFLFVQEAKPGIHGQAKGMPFVIQSQLELSWHQTLEAAELRRIELTNGRHNNVHMYVRVD